MICCMLLCKYPLYNLAAKNFVCENSRQLFKSEKITAVFNHVLQTNQDLSLAVLQGLVGRVCHLVAQLEDLALRPVTACLARFLLDQVEEPASTHPAVTRVLIANHLATTPDSISRSLRVLEKVGAIRFDRHRIIIVQPDILH